MLNKFRVGLGELSPAAQDIFLVDFGLIEAIEEVVGEELGMGHALEATVHEASVSQIGQTNFSQHAAFSHNHLDFLIQLLFFCKRAIPEVVPLVFLLAQLGAVGGLLAPAHERQLLVLKTTLALRFVGTFEEPVVIAVHTLSDQVVSVLQFQIINLVFEILYFFPHSVDSVEARERGALLFDVLEEQRHGHLA